VRVRTLPCESDRSAHLSNNSTQATGRKRVAELPGRTVAGGCTGNTSAPGGAVGSTRSFSDTAAGAQYAAASLKVTWVAGNSIRRDTRLNAHVTLAEAATALSAAIAGCAIRSTRSSARATDTVAVFATALIVILTLLTVALTAPRVGRSLTYAYGCQRSPYEGSTHQPKRLTARDASASQSSSKLVEGVLSCLWGHRLSLPQRGRGFTHPAVLSNVA